MTRMKRAEIRSLSLGVAAALGSVVFSAEPARALDDAKDRVDPAKMPYEVLRPDLGFFCGETGNCTWIEPAEKKDLDFSIIDTGSPLFVDYYFEVEQGVSARGCFNVGNNGTGASGPFEVLVEVFATSVKKRKRVPGGLKPGETWTGCVSLISRRSPLAPGVYKVDFVADWRNEVTEKDEVCSPGPCIDDPLTDNVVTRVLKIVE
jgi:hypothetical protein